MNTKKKIRLPQMLKPKYLLISLLLPAICYVLLFLYTEINPPKINMGPDQTQQQPALFFTDIYPQKILWLNNNEFLVQEEHRIVIYDIQNRRSKTIYENTDSSANTNASSDTNDTDPSTNTSTIIIKNCWWTGSTIIAAVENSGTAEDEKEIQILQYNMEGDRLPDGDKLTQRTLENVDFIEIDNGLICTTKNFVIENPEEIATLIEIKSFDTEEDKNNTQETSTQLKTSLTVKPLNCSRDKLILTQSSPFLEKNLYSWSPGEASPVLIKVDPVTHEAGAITHGTDLVTNGTEPVINSANPVTNVLYFPKHKTAGIQTLDSMVTLINIDTLIQHTINLHHATAPQPTANSKNDVHIPWTLTNSNEILRLNKTDHNSDNSDTNSNAYKIQLLQPQDTRDSQDTDNPIQVTTIAEFSSDENFLDIYPNNPITSFVLISEFGELWVLQL